MRTLTCLTLALTLGSTLACTKADDLITRSVMNRLAADPIVQHYHLGVSTDQKVVTITGTVDTSVAKDEAMKIVRSTPGIVDILDHMSVRDNEATYGWLKKSNGAIGTAGHR